MTPTVYIIEGLSAVLYCMTVNASGTLLFFVAVIVALKVASFVTMLVISGAASLPYTAIFGALCVASL